MKAKVLLLIIPLALTLSLWILTLIPKTWAQPFQWINVWTYIQSFSIAYLITTIILVTRNHKPDALRLAAFTATILLIATLLNQSNFGSLNYILTINKIPAFTILTLLITAAAITCGLLPKKT